MELTIVIICRNEIATIAATIQAALLVTPHIIVVDSGSTDGTLTYLQSQPITIINTTWQGFGPTKNIGIAAANTNWILSLDADEIIDTSLCNSIKNLKPQSITTVYKVNFLNYLGNTPIRYGEWSGDWHIRIFNKAVVQWNNVTVHETLEYKQPITTIKLQGKIHHKTSVSIAAMHTKLNYYALLNAEKYYKNGKKNIAIKKVVSPLFNFVQNYIVKFGFLDGKLGLQIALENALYTYKKYKYVQQLKSKKAIA